MSHLRLHCWPMRGFDHGLTLATNRHRKPSQKATHLLGKCYIYCCGQSTCLLVFSRNFGHALAWIPNAHVLIYKCIKLFLFGVPPSVLVGFPKSFSSKKHRSVSAFVLFRNCKPPAFAWVGFNSIGCFLTKCYLLTLTGARNCRRFCRLHRRCHFHRRRLPVWSSHSETERARPGSAHTPFQVIIISDVFQRFFLNITSFPFS